MHDYENIVMRTQVATSFGWGAPRGYGDELSDTYIVYGKLSDISMR